LLAGVLSGISAIQAQEISQEAIPNWTAAPFWKPASSHKGMMIRSVDGQAGVGAEGIEALAVASAPLPFIAITPCRLVDTRNASQTGNFGPPSLGVDATRNIPVPTHPVCTGIPATAGAYSLNMTVTNTGANPFGFLKVWPQGQPEPNVSTLNWAAGGVTIANAAIVPAGTAGGITIKSGNASSDVIIDINGYYAGTIVSSLVAGTGMSVSSPTGDVTVGIANGGVGLAQHSAAGSAAGQALVSTGAAVAWGSPTNFTGALAGEVTGTQGATVVSNAVPTNTVNAIVRRDGVGSFFANSLTLGGTLDLTGGVILRSGALLLHESGLDNLFVGVGAGNLTTTGLGSNVGVGAFALHILTSGANNSAIGVDALQNLTTGANNTGIGADALNANSTGNSNTAIGNNALAGVTGDGNVGIGNVGGSNLTTGSNNIDIGNAGVAAESDTIRIGTAQTKTFVAGVRGVTTVNANGIAVLVDSAGQLGTVSSSIVTKRDVTDIDDPSDALMKLRPVSFFYKSDKVGYRQYGLIAEEVADVMPELVQFDGNGAPQTVRYHFLAPLLLSEVQKQTQTIQDLEHTIDAQRAVISGLESRLSALEEKDKADKR